MIQNEYLNFLRLKNQAEANESLDSDLQYLNFEIEALQQYLLN